MSMLQSAFYGMKSLFLKSLFFLILLFVSFGYHVFFGFVTFVLTLLIFSRLEHDKKTHERTFYFIEKPSKIFAIFLTLSSKGEVITKSFVFGILTIILFSGTDYERTTSISFVFIAVIWLGALVLNLVEKNSKVHVERWGYIKISLLLGVVFSLLISTIDGIGLWEITKSVAKNVTVHGHAYPVHASSFSRDSHVVARGAMLMLQIS